MNCLPQWLSGRPQRHEDWERPVCVCPSMPLIGEVVGTVSPQEQYAVCCAQASQALRTNPPAVCFDTPHVEAPAQEDMQVSGQEYVRVSVQEDMHVWATPSLEFDWAYIKYDGEKTPRWCQLRAGWFCKDKRAAWRLL